MLVFSPWSLQFPEAENEFQKEVFAFCRAWKSGQQEFVFHTSGSTGKPKQLVISREKMIYSTNLTAKWLNLKENDTALLCLPIHYIAGAMVLVRSLILNLKLVLIEPVQNPLIALKDSNLKIDLASFVPTQWAQMMDQKDELKRIFHHSKGVLIGGAGLNVDLEKKTSTLSFPVFHTYAMTETVSHIAFRQLNKTPQETVYQVFSEIMIDKNELNCLKIKSYLTDNKWLETNDLVEIQSENSFQLLGRNDFVINSGGFKIQPQKIEILSQEFFVSLGLSIDLFLFGVEDELLGQKAVLFVNKSEALSNFKNLKDYLKSHLDAKEIPKDCIYLPEFQFNANGKMDRIKTVNLYFNNKT